MSKENEYPKINGLYKRDGNGKFNGVYSTPEFELLKDVDWIAIEKVDGTNVRIVIQPDGGFQVLGRTDNAQFKSHWIAKISSYAQYFIDDFKSEHEVVVYGECYGEGIQKNPLKKTGVHFIVFDMKLGEYWLDYEFLSEYCKSKNIPYAQKYLTANRLSIWEGHLSSGGVQSIDNPICISEGFILKPRVQIFDKYGHRIMTKLKVTDYA